MPESGSDLPMMASAPCQLDGDHQAFALAHLDLEAALFDESRAKQRNAWRERQDALREVHDFARVMSLSQTNGGEDEAGCDAFVRALTGWRFLMGLLRRSGEDRIAAVRASAAFFHVGDLLSDDLLHLLLRRRMLFGLLRLPRAVREACVRQIVAPALRHRPARDLAAMRDALGRAADEMVGLLAGPPASLETSETNGTAGDFLRARGWGPRAPALPHFPGQHLKACFGFGARPDAAELAWVKCVVHAWQLPHSAAAVIAATARLLECDLFDADFYRSRTAITASDASAAMHYILVGDALGLAPSNRFDPAYYRDRYPDVTARGEMRLLHYIDHGRREGRHPLPPVTRRVNVKQMDRSLENVILVVHETSRTGAPVLGWNIARHLAHRYNVFTVILGDGPLTPDFDALSVETHGPFRHAHAHPVDLEYSLGRLLDQNDFKYTIINSCESRTLIAACAARHIPTIMLMHEFGSYVYARDSLREAFDLATEIVFPAQMVAESSLNIHPPLRRRPIRIVPQGMSLLPGMTDAPHSFSPILKQLADAHAAGTFVVLGAGSVEFRKGVDLFLATAMAVCRAATNRSIHFVWIGHGYRPDEDMAYSIYLREQVMRSDLLDHVTFLEAVADLDPVYALSDLFLLASRLDPLPNVSIDAAVRGIPIVCFNGASGMSEILLSDDTTASSVVAHLDTAAAGCRIVTLANDREAWLAVASATRHLARSLFDMADYVSTIDALGSNALRGDRLLLEDADLLSRTDDFDQDLYLGPQFNFEARATTIRRALGSHVAQGKVQSRRTAPGFSPRVWRRAHPGTRDALADFIRAGRPDGPWVVQVIRPAETPADVSSGMKATLHVHLADPDRIADFLTRLHANRSPVDLVISTDTTAMAEQLRSRLDTHSGLSVEVAIAPDWKASPIHCLQVALGRPGRPRRHRNDIVGHLHDGGIGANAAVIDFHWTALLGSRHPMLDRILDAFAQQPALGLIYPADPRLPDPDAAELDPSGEMFWARRVVLDELAVCDAASGAEQSLPAACEVNGMKRAAAHVPGVFI